MGTRDLNLVAYAYIMTVRITDEIEKSGVCFFNAQTKEVFAKARVKMWDEMYSELLEEKCQLQAKLGGKAAEVSKDEFTQKIVCSLTDPERASVLNLVHGQSAPEVIHQLNRKIEQLHRKFKSKCKLHGSMRLSSTSKALTSLQRIVEGELAASRTALVTS